MSTLTGTSGLNTIFSASFLGEISGGDAAAEDLFDLKLDQNTVLDTTTTFVRNGGSTATHLFGTDSGADGSLDLVGTGFTGSNGTQQIAAKGTITHAIFEGNDGSGFDLTGAVNWTFGAGLVKGTVSHLTTHDASGNTLEITGKINADFSDDSLAVTTGTVTYERVTTAAGLTFEVHGNFGYDTTTGTISSVSMDDGAGHSITLSGSYQNTLFTQVLSDSSDFGDFFSDSRLYTGNDRLVTNDTNYSWHGGAGNDVVFGGGSAGDKLFGDAGNDTLDGGALADTLTGGIGDDVYYVDNASDLVSELTGEGKDTVFSSVNVTLGVNVENLTLTSTAISGTGNGGNNVITGNALDNTLDGGSAGGLDTLIGGLGNDYYVIHDTTTKITDTGGHDTVEAFNNYTAAAGIEEIHATAFADVLLLVGNTGDNIVIGNNGTNTLRGGTGDDTLDGFDGVNDLLDGGAGDDTYYLHGVEIITDASGTDTVYAAGSYTLGTGLENLSLEGAVGNFDATGNVSNNFLAGNDGDNTLTGLGGNDTMDGGLGNDHLIGGLGNDTYALDNVGDVASENAGEGTDTVFVNFDYNLLDNFEVLIATSSGHSLGGNAANNTIIGSDFGSDSIDGGAGADKMIGGGGDDTYYVDNKMDTITEGAGIGGGHDTVYATVDYTLSANADVLVLAFGAIKGTGSNGGDTIIGTTGANTLSGMGGDDTLAGGTGNDVLTGGAGLDTFFVSQAGSFHTITDFNKTQDTINIHDLLVGYTDGVSDIHDFVHVVAGAGGYNVLQIDRNGTSGGFTIDSTISVKGAVDLDTLINGGHLIA